MRTREVHKGTGRVLRTLLKILKDNLSMINKRLRCREYVGSFVTAEISKKINRITSLGPKAQIKDFMSIFKFPEDIFITKLYSSGVLRYAETNNDIDFINRFKYTKKGERYMLMMVS